jgi:hypothetical protein
MAFPLSTSSFLSSLASSTCSEQQQSEYQSTLDAFATVAIHKVCLEAQLLLLALFSFQSLFHPHL